MAVYLITGASGYIGSMLGTHLLENEADPQVLAMTRSSDIQSIWKASSMGRVQVIRADLSGSDLFDAGSIPPVCAQIDHIDYILHCAAATSSLEMIHHPVEVTRSIVNATQNVLELARRYKIKSMVYLSSMEVYGDMDCPEGHRATEDSAGDGRVELFNVRSCYPLGKRMAENMCYSYFKEYGIPVKIARLAQVFGRGIRSGDDRIFAQFARSAKADKDIVLHTEGRSMGNYCGIDDAVSGILTILRHGQDGEAYNVVNEENTMTIRQMADLVADQIADGRIKVRLDIPEDNRYGYAADTGLRMSGRKLAQLGWRPRESLADMYREML